MSIWILDFLPPFSSGKMSSCLSPVLAFGVGRAGGVFGQRGLWIRLGMVLFSVSNHPLQHELCQGRAAGEHVCSE